MLAFPICRRADYPMTIHFDAFTIPFRVRAAGGINRPVDVRDGSPLSTS